MTLKVCACCGKLNTTKTAKKIGREKVLGMDAIYFNCECKSTFLLMSKKTRKRW